MRRLVVAFALLVVGGCAAGEHPWSSTALCAVERGGGEEEPKETAWLSLLLAGWDPATRRATHPAVDCTGAQVRWEGPALRCTDGSTALADVPDRPLGPDDVVVSKLGDDYRIVWIVTNRYASGDGLGPVAVVEVRPRRLIVRAIGHLRANLVRPRLRLERLGDREVLVAEGEVCSSADPSSCARSARVMPLERERYVAAPVTSEDGACVSPALFDLGREESASLPSGWRRRYRLDATLSFLPTTLRVKEAVVVSDYDPRHPNTPERPYRRAEAETDVRHERGRFVTASTSLWAKMLEAR
jgi:hypothetical protein